MQMKLAKTIFFKELRDMLRDRRTLFIMVVLPMIMYPLLFIGMMQMLMFQLGKVEQKSSRIAIVGRENAVDLAQKVESTSGVRITDTLSWQEKIVNADIDAALIILPGFGDSVAAGKIPTVELCYNNAKDISLRARDRLESTLSDYRQSVVAQRLVSLSADTTLLRPFAISKRNLATAQQQQGHMLGMYLGYMLILMTLMGAFYPAVDMTAGEKERGTMETLLVSPASRADIVYGKFAAVMVIAITTAMLNLLSMGATGLYMMHFAGKSAASAFSTIAISPLSLLLSLALIIPLAVAFAALFIAIAVSARNYKEGTSMLSPLMSVVILPAFVSVLPGTEMSPLLAVVPVANVSLLIKEFMAGNYPWLYTLMAFGSMSLLAVAALAWATSQFKQEAVLFRHAEDVRWSPFRRRRGILPSPFPSPGTAVLLVAVELILLTVLSSAVADQGVQRMLLITQMAVLIPPLFILRRGGYEQKRVLALKKPASMAWPATLLLIFGAWIFAIELASLQNMFMPFPKEMLEKFTHFFNDLNKMPLRTALFFVALLPGICEELLCRGFLLHSFIPRFGKWGAVIVTAVAFGLLHMDPYRFLATTFLGVLLGFIVIRTGSIFPAMLAHATNNALSFLVEKNQAWIAKLTWLDSETAQLLPWWAVALSLLMVGAGILWLNHIGEARSDAGVVTAPVVVEETNS
ncbi:MAG TPA: ABC transporter permease subunit/CPBP intramembrane protease [bacterium]|jgi:sodium transport system permease protein